MPAAAAASASSCDFFSSIGCLFAATIRSSDGGDENQTTTAAAAAKKLDLSSLRVSQLQVTPNGAYFIADCDRKPHLQLLSHQSIFGTAAAAESLKSVSDEIEQRHCGLDNSEIDIILNIFTIALTLQKLGSQLQPALYNEMLDFTSGSNQYFFITPKSNILLLLKVPLASKFTINQSRMYLKRIQTYLISSENKQFLETADFTEALIAQLNYQLSI